MVMGRKKKSVFLKKQCIPTKCDNVHSASVFIIYDFSAFLLSIFVLPTSARLQSASRQTFTSGSFSGYCCIMDTSLGITPFSTSCICWAAERERHGADGWVGAQGQTAKRGMGIESYRRCENNHGEKSTENEWWFIVLWMCVMKALHEQVVANQASTKQEQNIHYTKSIFLASYFLTNHKLHKQPKGQQAAFRIWNPT